jgi:hypothetical protein
LTRGRELSRSPCWRSDVGFRRVKAWRSDITRPASPFHLQRNIETSIVLTLAHG